MAIRNIYLDGDPILRKKCRPVTSFDEKLHTLIDDMHDTLDKADGVGLAAPQVGICRRIFIIHLTDEEGNVQKIEAVNPEICDLKGNQHVLEGCLSVPDKWGYVDRPQTLTLKALDRNGEPFEMSLEGLGAQCAAHERAHLDGELFTDIATEIVRPEDLEEARDKSHKNRRSSK